MTQTTATRPTAAPLSRGALAGIRVIEIGQMIAGPFAGRMMADFGAEVIKIEPPGVGDPMRHWGHLQIDGQALWWPSIARNKKSVSLDLRKPEGQTILRKLVAEADVLIENFRPGTLEKWGIGPEKLHEFNPGLVIARVSGYGQTGPYADRVGFASIGEAMGGLRYINGYPGEAPPRCGISLGDSLTAMTAFQGILMALLWRAGEGKGRGQVVDAAITESCFAMMEGAITEYGLLGAIREPSGSSLTGLAPSNIYLTKDKVWMVIAANADSLFVRLCEAMGQPELARDPRFCGHVVRGQNEKLIDQIISEWAATKTKDEMTAILTEAGVVCGPIYTIADIHADPHFRARGMVTEVDDPELGRISVPGPTPVLSETPGRLEWTGPGKIGAHTSEVLSDLLHLSEQEIDALKQQKVI